MMSERVSPQVQQTGTTFRVLTHAAPGAVALIELAGQIEGFLEAVLDLGRLSVGAMRLRRLGEIDTALVVRISPSVLWLMPHGGPRIVQRLSQWLASAGVRADTSVDATLSFPEARSAIDSLALEAVSRASSPLAIDLLLDQHRRWALYRQTSVETIEAIRTRSRFLSRLIIPPLVVVVGRPNVGKSTLTNSLLGREASITSDMQGTTRDYVLTQLDLAGVVVRWCDTPGRHNATDLTEREAIGISSALIDAADCLISAAAPGIDWPELSRPPDLRIRLKADLDPSMEVACVDQLADSFISAKTGSGLAEFVARIRDWLVPAEALRHPGPWLFDPRIETG